MKVSIIIPVYNEEKTLGSILSKTPKEYEILVVNDGSTDRSSEIAELFGVKTIMHEKNLGYDESIKAGFLNSTGDILVTMDGDGEHSPVYIYKLIKRMKETGADIVLGERTNLPRLSESFISWIARTRVKNIRDFTTGFRAIRRRSLEGISLDSMAFGVNLILRMKKKGLKIESVKISSTRRKKSRIKLTKIIPRIFSVLRELLVD